MKRPVRITLALFCLLVLLAGMLGFMACNSSTNTNANGMTGTPTPAPVVDCNTATPEQILKTVYEVLEKSKYAPQLWQFNITVSAKVLTIKGWSPDYLAIEQLVKTTASGCSVNPTPPDPFKPAYCDLDPNLRLIRTCAQNYYPCGDICIPVGEICRINSLDGPTHVNTNYNCAVGSPQPTGNTNANGNSNGNTNTKY